MVDYTQFNEDQKNIKGSETPLFKDKKIQEKIKEEVKKGVQKTLW